MLKEGNTAPDFALLGQDEQTYKLSDYPNTWKIIYFYPKDDTPGCTKEACTIAEIYNDFEKLGVKVFGVSKDSPQSHKKFAEKFSLPFTLLSDENTEMIKAYGAWQKKSSFGRESEGIARITYLLNEDNQVVKTYPKVTPAAHAMELLNDIKELKA